MQYPSQSEQSLDSELYAPQKGAADALLEQSGCLPIRLFNGLTLRVERRGFILAGLTVLFYIISAFVGNEWCYLMPAGICAVVFIGMVLPVIGVQSIDTGFSVACSPANVDVPELRVWLKRKPIFGLLLLVVPSGYLSASLILTRRTWRSSPAPSMMVPLPGMIESLNRGFEARLRLPVLKRGVYRLKNVSISSCFPFSIAWCTRLAPAAGDDAEREITVYPRLIPLRGDFHNRLSLVDESTGCYLHSWIRPNQSVNLRGLREFSERDSLTHIHWSSSAKAGKLMVREFEVEAMAQYDVVFDTTRPWSCDQFELAVTAVYSLIRYGQRFGFTPAFYMIPDHGHPLLAELLADCPGGLAGEELAAELLARIAPLTGEVRQNVEVDAVAAANHAISCSVSAGRCLLGVLPGCLPTAPGKDGCTLVEYRRTSLHASRLEDGLPVLRHLGYMQNETELSRL